MSALPPFDNSWGKLLAPHEGRIASILGTRDVAPSYENVFAALALPLEKVRVVIFGQDPYPTPGQATGLAFSIPRNFQPLPPTLKNIYRELSDDVGGATPSHGDLSSWSQQGVLLLNRTLTIRAGESNSDQNIGWREITDAIAQELGKRKVCAILWGKNAEELSRFFRSELTIQSPHPSPLSAYRGFFGSKPFSRSNEILESIGLNPIDWSIK
jgi:uracil-DNA glycosylase